MTAENLHDKTPKDQTPVAGDATYTPDHHPALALLHVMNKHGQATPERIAELIAEHPGDLHAVMAEVHKTRGNGVAGAVTKALHAAQKAQKQNLDMVDVLEGHENDTGYTDHASKHTGKKVEDPNRIADNHHRTVLEQACGVYDNEGNKLADLVANQKIRINTAAVSRVKIGEDEVECVYGFRMEEDQATAPKKNIGGMGWVPITALKQDATTAHIVKLDRSLQKKVDAERVTDPGSFKPPVKLALVPLDKTDARYPLHTMQKQTSEENLAKHYFQMQDGTANLLFNVPGSSASRVGAASDRVAQGTEFHAATNVTAMHSPLWEHGDKAIQTSYVLTFVYGYVTHQDGSKHFGWINQELLG